MMTSLESHARHVLSVYAKDAGAHVESSLLEKLIAAEIVKAVNESRDELRDKMVCDGRDPCAFNDVCAHHKALAGAMMATPLVHR
jgi:hypothetical protein